jgi:hypothetical protein
MDVQYEISGDANHLLLHLKAYELTKDEPVIDPSIYMDLQGWTGRQWVDLAVPQDNKEGMDVPLNGILPDNRRVSLRFRAKTDFILELPTGDAY